MKGMFAAAAVLSLCTLACGGKSPTSPSSQTPAPATTMFTGTLAPRGSQATTFSLSQAGTAAVTLISLTTAQGDVSGAAVSLSVGNASGSSCSPTTTVSATPALKAHAAPSLQAGNYCVTISDTGALDAPLAFVVRIVSYPVTTTGDATALDTVITNLPAGGFLTRTFTVAKGGIVSVTLSSLSPSASVGVGIGVAVSGSNSPCSLSTVVRTDPQATPQITIAADPGDYCVKVFDMGDLAAITRGIASMSMTIAHP